MLSRIDVIILIFIALLIALFVAFAVWWWFIRKPPLPKAIKCNATEKGTLCLDNGFIVAMESTTDDSMPNPTGSLKLLNFDYNSEFPPWCIPSFYAIRYVDKEGNYGQLSSWFGPVVSEPTANPGGCFANLPNLVAQDLQDPNLDKYYINVHRQDLNLNETSEGRVVGMLEPITYGFIDDPSSNPNADGKIMFCKNYGC